MPNRKARASISRLNCALLLCASILVPDSACAASRIGGIYIDHAERYVSMLQLTESGNGQISGVLSTINLQSDGSIDPDNLSITSGAIDGNQLTLHFSASASALLGGNMGGTVDGNVIRLQSIGKDGTVQSWLFQRASLEDFKTFADRLKADGAAIVLNSKLQNDVQKFHQAVSTAGAWISDAELHAERIPAVEDQLRRIENQMHSLVARERMTPNTVARSQLSVAVSQLEVNGTQADLQINQLWDLTIGDSGKRIDRMFGDYSWNCDRSSELLQRKGATVQNADEWQNACQQALSERNKFQPVFEKIMKQRADLTSFQTTAEARRQKLVDEASRASDAN